MYQFRRQCDETNVLESEAVCPRVALSLISKGDPRSLRASVSLSGGQESTALRFSHIKKKQIEQLMRTSL